MWKNWLLGILGLWIILLPFLGLNLTLARTLFIITGIAVAVLGFWAATSRPYHDSGRHSVGGGQMM
ncbi:MAG: hypothetical protein HY445_01940 [Candidatus Niyogibacteria bacterium]|nr:hypothetical protein [Candidatus Niyogibacteria bacterium]